MNVTRPELEAVLARIEESPGFCRSAGLTRFLRHIAIETLEGRGERLKEYTIAVEVFGRPSSYDPQVDSLVRVQASALRSRLGRYYAADGLDDPVVLEIPKGGYQVHFGVGRGRPGATVNGAANSLEPSPAPVLAVPGAPPTRFRALAAASGLVALLAIAGVWFFASARPGPQSVPSANSIVVLPFVDTSPVAAQSFLGDTIADELIRALSTLPGVRVVARTSAFQYKQKSQDIARIGRDLSVSYVVEGSVRREGPAMRIIAELVNVTTGRRVWSAAYDRPADDLLGIEEEIAQSIATSLRTHNVDGAFTRVAAPAPEAYRHYMTGKYWRVEPTLVHLKRALDEFAAAIAADRTYAPAYAALAECLTRLTFTEMLPLEPGADTVAELSARARKSAQRALELDDLLSSAHEAAALVHLVDWEFPQADKEFRRALQLDPTDVRVRYAFAQLLLSPGLHYDEATGQLRSALDLDPVSVNLITELGATYRMAHRPESAMAEFSRSLDLNPRAYGTRTNVAEVDMEAGRYPQAIGRLEAVNTEDAGDPWILGHLGYAYAKGGRTADARTVLATLLKTSTAAMHIAAVQAALREDGQALDTLEKGVARHSLSVLWLRTDFRFAALRSNPRFAAICSKLPQ